MNLPSLRMQAFVVFIVFLTYFALVDYLFFFRIMPSWTSIRMSIMFIMPMLYTTLYVALYQRLFGERIR